MQIAAISGLEITRGLFIDAGNNIAQNNGSCQGFYIQTDNKCQPFSVTPADPVIVYPYIPGDLSKYDEESGFALATGLRIRQLARSNEKVAFGSKEAGVANSEIPFHRDPDGAAVVEAPDGGWVYISNSESTKGDRTGGVFAVIFDSEGEIKGYEPRLLDTTRNCNGGLTPWKTWVSCEEHAKGQCWQVDPSGEIEPEILVIGGDGGNYEAFVSTDPLLFILYIDVVVSLLPC